MRPERIVKLEQLLVHSYPEYFTFYKSPWGGYIFYFRDMAPDEAQFIMMAANKFEHLLEL